MTDLTNHSDDDSVLDPWTLESLLDGAEPATDDAAAPLAALIASTRRPGDAFELRGAADVLAAFREISAVDEPVSAPTRRIAMLSTITRSKLIIAVTAGALSVGAASAAALTGTLPDGAQNVAHRLLNAPAPGGHGVGPDATGPAAQGLCAAWTDHQASGETPSSSSVAFRNLATAAGGEDGIATYCASVMTPTATATATATDTATETATPTETETATSTTEPTTSPAKGQLATHPGQGAAQWTAHGRTDFPGQGASHWPKADGTKPGKPAKTATSTATDTESPTATETETPTATDTETPTATETSAS
jgi:hypothetical protein